MSDHGTDHGTFLACTPTTRSQRSRHADTYAHGTDHGTDHADHAPSDHASPLLFTGGGALSIASDPKPEPSLPGALAFEHHPSEGETTMSTATISHRRSDHKPDRAAPLKPQGRRIWIVRWVVADGHETKRHVYLTRHSAAKFLGMLLSAGRDAAMFEAAVDWQEVDQ